MGKYISLKRPINQKLYKLKMINKKNSIKKNTLRSIHHLHPPILQKPQWRKISIYPNRYQIVMFTCSRLQKETKICVEFLRQRFNCHKSTWSSILLWQFNEAKRQIFYIHFVKAFLCLLVDWFPKHFILYQKDALEKLIDSDFLMKKKMNWY
jgi:hypothetical protein